MLQCCPGELALAIALTCSACPVPVDGTCYMLVANVPLGLSGQNVALQGFVMLSSSIDKVAAKSSGLPAELLALQLGLRALHLPGGSGSNFPAYLVNLGLTQPGYGG